MDLLSHAVGGRQDVSVSDEGAATELSSVVHEGRYPGPLSLVSRPAVHHFEGMLTFVVNPFLLLGHGAVAVVSDGVILSPAAVSRVGGAWPRWALRGGGLVSHGNRGRAWRGTSSWGRPNTLKNLGKMEVFQ